MTNGSWIKPLKVMSKSRSLGHKSCRLVAPSSECWLSLWGEVCFALPVAVLVNFCLQCFVTVGWMWRACSL